MISSITHIIRSKGWTRKTAIRYILLQIPSFMLILMILYFVKKPLNLPLWSIILVMFLWMFKDFIMFFFVWRAYIPSGGADPTKMVGRTGVAKDALHPAGYVYIEGELWYAEVKKKNQKIEPGSKIVVRESHGLTLFVEPAEKERTVI